MEAQGGWGERKMGRKGENGRVSRVESPTPCHQLKMRIALTCTQHNCKLNFLLNPTFFLGGEAPKHLEGELSSLGGI